MLNVFKIYKGQYKHKFAILTHLKNFFKKVKWSYQRITKGYCDYDLYNLDQYYKNLMWVTLLEFSRKTNSYPSQFDDIKDWQIMLQNAANQFKQSGLNVPNIYENQLIKRSKQLDEIEYEKLLNLSIRQNIRDQKIKQLHFEKGLNFIKKYNQDLWD